MRLRLVAWAHNGLPVFLDRNRLRVAGSILFLGVFAPKTPLLTGFPRFRTYASGQRGSLQLLPTRGGIFIDFAAILCEGRFSGAPSCAENRGGS